MENEEHCHCSEPGCMFAGLPPTLRDHLVTHHDWFVTPITVGKVLEPEMHPVERRRLLATEDGEHVFLLVASDLGGGEREVKVVCIRAGVEEGPWRYWSTLWMHGPVNPQTGRGDLLTAKYTMRSCAVPSEEATMAVGGLSLRVPSHMATADGGLVLRLRVEKVEV